jgi:sarcosine oxidase subunit beta
MIGKLFQKTCMWRKHPLKSGYDVVIVGAGVHGLATAYYLGKQHGVRKVALLEKSYLGAGNSGRNTAILRSNYRTPEGIEFYDIALKLYERMSEDLGFNVLFTQGGHLTLAHSDSGIVGLRVRAENNQLMGVDSRLIFPEEIGRLVPALDLSKNVRYPILAALYHPPGGVIRHDAVVWAYAHACDEMGIEIHPMTEVTAIRRDGRKISAVITNRGEIATETVVNCTAGWATTVSDMAGVRLPIVSHPLQACVTEPLKPFLDQVIVSATLHVYVNQTDKGELVIGAEIDPYQSYSTKGTLPTLEQMASYSLELFPQLHSVRVLRQWAGVCDMTPDFAPIIGQAEEVDGFYMNVGWGTYGFKAGPAGGRFTAELVATRRTPAVIAPFAPSRFRQGRQLGEKAAAAVSH